MESKAFVCMSPVQICLQSQAGQVWILKMGVRLRVGPTSSSMGSKGTYRTFTAGINLTF